VNLHELMARLESIKSEGFIPSLRKGSTGVGYTFEKVFGLEETNIPIPDIGGRVEIKTTRKDTTALMTLFTFNRGVWRVRQKEAIDKYGYVDKKGRKALKSTVFCNGENSLGLYLEVDERNHRVDLFHSSGELVASWDLLKLVGTFYSKLGRLLFVLADRRRRDGVEEFHFNEAYLLTEPQTRNFFEGFRNSIIGIDVRMHLKENGAVRNRGTAFRVREIDIISLYADRRRIL